ncbi:MAG TPA: NADH-quinone oxidoreductase subunit C [Terriglobia bacterium]|jgi:NADH-quinone oxidoreductase subunit C|nr:NADH-quinone oxidoreductase subunit C [Terriglobia bacterium]
MAEDSLTLTKLQEKFAGHIVEIHSFRGDDTAIIQPAAIVPVATFLKVDPELDYNYLMDLTAVDCLRLGKPYRFEVVYHFFSLGKKHRVRVKLPVEARNPEVNSISSLWAGADWYEREVWDMFGIKFRGHPNLKRILMYEEFEGHPLRKDYPIRKRQPLIGPGSPSQPQPK